MSQLADSRIDVPQPPLRLIERTDASRANALKALILDANPERLRADQVRPTEVTLARPNTLSSRYGLAPFPFHTDFAAHDVPPRYIVLAASRPRATATLVLDTASLMTEFGVAYLRRCLYLQEDRPSRYRRLVTLTPKGPMFRFNHAILRPLNREAEIVSEFLESGVPRVTRVDWSLTRVAVIDNWNALHAREACAVPDGIGLRRFALWRH